VAWKSLAMSPFQRIDDWMFNDPPDRITLSEDNRAYVRLPARGLRFVTRTLWLIATCSWTNILIPFTILALILDPVSLSISTSFWLNFSALLPVIGLFRYSSEVLSVEAPASIKLIWDFTLGPFSPDVEVRSQERKNDTIKYISNLVTVGSLHRNPPGTLQSRQNIRCWQSIDNTIIGESHHAVQARMNADNDTLRLWDFVLPLVVCGAPRTPGTLSLLAHTMHCS
jgi:hypothetical protein